MTPGKEEMIQHIERIVGKIDVDAEVISPIYKTLPIIIRMDIMIGDILDYFRKTKWCIDNSELDLRVRVENESKLLYDGLRKKLRRPLHLQNIECIRFIYEVIGDHEVSE